MLYQMMRKTGPVGGHAALPRLFTTRAPSSIRNGSPSRRLLVLNQTLTLSCQPPSHRTPSLMHGMCQTKNRASSVVYAGVERILARLRQPASMNLIRHAARERDNGSKIQLFNRSPV